MKTLAVTEYIEKFELLRRLQSAEKRDGDHALENEIEDELLALWNRLSVDECKEVERCYPELKVAV